MAIALIKAEMTDLHVITRDNCYQPYQEVIDGKPEEKQLRCDIAIRQQLNADFYSWGIVELKY